MHRWFMRRLDTLLGTGLAVLAGAAASQLFAFIQQYLQRLGGHLDEARRTHEQIVSDDLYAQLGPDALALLVSAADRRVTQLNESHDAIAKAGLVDRPFQFFAHVDTDIAKATLESFQPALPLDAASLIYAASGIVLALIAYELVKLPFAVSRRKTESG